jgi:hypothetical protein
MSDMAEACVPRGSLVVPKQPSISDKLDLEIERAAERSKKALRVKELFKENPDLKEVLDLLVDLSAIHVSY